MEPKRYKKGDMFIYNGILHQFTSDEISLEEDSFMYEPDYSFIPKSFWEDLRKEVEKLEMEPVNFNRPENIRQEFWDAIDDIIYMVGKNHDISLSLNLTPDGVLNVNVYPCPWPEDEDDEDEDFEGEEWK